MAQAVLAPSKRMTWEEFLAWEPERDFHEWVDGEVIEFMSAEAQHQLILQFLSSLLDFFTQKFQIGQIMTAPYLIRIAFRPAGREPDLIFIAKENLHRMTSKYLDGPADLAIEIISPDSVTRDRVTKLAEYEKSGVREYWIIDYKKQETLFYQLNAQGAYQRIYEDENGRYDSAVIAGFWLNVNWLWRQPRPLLEAAKLLGI